jgi:hypothetical protein
LISDVRAGLRSRRAGLSAAGSQDSQTRAVCSLAASTQAGQDLRGWDHSRGLVSFLGQRAAEIGTDGEAAVQAGEAQQLRDRDPAVTARLSGDGGEVILPG